MREILFRGKRIDNGEWVYGFLYESEKSSTYNAESFILEKERLTINYKCVEGITTHIPFVQVTPDTVGQYTGLTDKNGKKIFEGDIILRRYVRPCFLVEYSEEETEYQANFFDGSCASLYKYFSSKESKVIGNIHDNPELLEDKL